MAFAFRRISVFRDPMGISGEPYSLRGLRRRALGNGQRVVSDAARPGKAVGLVCPCGRGRMGVGDVRLPRWAADECITTGVSGVGVLRFDRQLLEDLGGVLCQLPGGVDPLACEYHSRATSSYGPV